MPKCFGLFLLLLVLPSLAPCILGRLEHFFRHTHKENNTKPKATGNTLGKKFQLTMHKLNHSLEPTLPVCTGQPSSNLFQSWPFSTPCVVDVSDQPQINHPCPPQCVSCHRSAAARLGQRGPGKLERCLFSGLLEASLAAVWVFWVFFTKAVGSPSRLGTKLQAHGSKRKGACCIS